MIKKAVIAVIIIFVISAIGIYATSSFAKKTDYSLWYEDLVKETVESTIEKRIATEKTLPDQWRQYAAECWNDSTYLPQGGYNAGWYHQHEPNFGDFMQWLETHRITVMLNSNFDSVKVVVTFQQR